ncbi:MAG TPA: HAMP domain-containing sensor histidine kinase [Candidatus Acidoferrales bacterium]|nr:HAMP domain-containing sensor histidine kinase [Candidatus Acidoferrales bacterium]
MTQAVAAVADLVAAAFLGLAGVAAADWWKERARARALLALALGQLALVAVLGRLEQASGYRGFPVMVVSVLAFLGSGYCVLLFRHSILPLPRLGLALAAALLAVSVGLGVVLAVPGLLALQRVLSWVLVLTWVVYIGEPVIRFWVSAAGRPRVQRARLRFLSAGLAGIALLLLFSMGETRLVGTPAISLVIQLAVLAAVPIIGAGLHPPTWLRRQWLAAEEPRFRLAIHDLLLFSPDTSTLARRALDGVLRLVGADAGLISDEHHAILARRSLSEVDGAEILGLGAGPHAQIVALKGSQRAVVIRFPLDRGTAILAVLTGPFTPLFGADEVEWLSAYASSVSAGLERVRVTERLSSLERSKTQFLNLASHELRGPLTVLRGYLSMMEAGSLSDGNLGRALEVMLSKANDMNNLVDEMLQVAQLEEGDLKLQAEVVDLRDIVSTALDRVRPLIGPDHPVVIAQPDQEVQVRADSGRLEIVVRNLIDNAVKYSPRGGTVSCRVEIDPLAERAFIHVRDHGIGIEAADKEVLFTKFGRIVNSLTSGIPGSGLGLYLARELVAMHGGEVSVESTPGEGSTFSIALPTLHHIGGLVPNGPAAATDQAQSVPSPS